jgi:arginyl-tRNA synthetase
MNKTNLDSQEQLEQAFKAIDAESKGYIDAAKRKFDRLLERDSEDFKRGVVESLKMIFEYTTKLNAVTMKLTKGTDVKLDLLLETIDEVLEEKVLKNFDQDTLAEQ